MIRSALAVELAPPAPPCFATRLIWLAYLESAAEFHRPGHAPGPLLFPKGGPVTFNHDFNICEDCTAQHSFEMHRQGLCKPGYLKSIAPTQAAE